MSDEEQRINIRFCVLLGHTVSETHTMLQAAYGQDAVSLSTVRRWHSRFQDGRSCVKDDPKSGRPRSVRVPETINFVDDVISENARISVDQVSQVTGISTGSAHKILHDDLGMHKVCSRSIPHSLTADQMENRIIISADLMEEADRDPSFTRSIITADESWCYLFDPKTKAESRVWMRKTDPPEAVPVAPIHRSRKKVLVTTFFDSDGLVHAEFLPQGETVTAMYYEGVLQRLLERIQRSRPNFLPSGKWYLQHDNARPHTAVKIQQFIAKHSITVLPHPPYSPDLAPCDFFLFPRVKASLRGRQFTCVSDVEQACLDAINAIPKEAFKQCFHDLYIRWQKCVVAEGRYFERL
jgi:[histone H3]-lysine36 N-dimethyltransferase SETMAR